MDNSKKDIYFKGIPLVAFKDKRLTRNAKMIYYEMYYYISTTEGRISPDFLSSLSKGTRAYFYKGWEELKKLGYVKKYYHLFATYNGVDHYLCEYDILDEPDTTTPYQIYDDKKR